MSSFTSDAPPSETSDSPKADAPRPRTGRLVEEGRARLGGGVDRVAALAVGAAADGGGVGADESATEEASSPSKAEEAASKAEEELPAALLLGRAAREA